MLKDKLMQEMLTKKKKPGLVIEISMGKPEDDEATETPEEEVVEEMNPSIAPDVKDADEPNPKDEPDMNDGDAMEMARLKSIVGDEEMDEDNIPAKKLSGGAPSLHERAKVGMMKRFKSLSKK